MKKNAGQLLAFMLLLALLLPAGFAEEGGRRRMVNTEENIVTADQGAIDSAQAAQSTGNAILPLDFSGGTKPIKSGFIDATHYVDPTISVSIDSGRYKECDYWVATIKIADASQLRTVSAGGFDTGMQRDGTKLASRVNAVLAIDGDFYWYNENRITLRQGVLYKNTLTGNQDVLLIDEDGDFYGLHKPRKEDVGDTINGKRIVNAFYFGPILVENGEMRELNERDLKSYTDMSSTDKRQRMAIAQVGPLEYKCICCAGPARGSNGLTLEEFARLVFKQNVLIAYNLDGGNSCLMAFNSKKINDPKNWDERKLADIIYFASAYEEKK